MVKFPDERSESVAQARPKRLYSARAQCQTTDLAVKPLLALVPVMLLCAASLGGAEEHPARTFYTGHSFAGAGPVWLGILARQANLAGYENLGRQALGGSRVADHWKLAEERNEAKKSLLKGGMDVLTLSPNMQLPDEGIDLFVDLALMHNPKIRVLVQGSWMTWDGLGKDGLKNIERDGRPVSEIRERTARHMEEIRAQLRATNARVGREICTLIPVGTAVVRLRELVADGKLPALNGPRSFSTTTSATRRHRCCTSAPICISPPSSSVTRAVCPASATTAGRNRTARPTRSSRRCSSKSHGKPCARSR